MCLLNAPARQGFLSAPPQRESTGSEVDPHEFSTVFGQVDPPSDGLRDFGEATPIWRQFGSVPGGPIKLPTTHEFQCRGTKTMIKLPKAREIFRNPGNQWRRADRTKSLMQKGDASGRIAWFATRRLAVRSRSSPLNTKRKFKLRHLAASASSSLRLNLRFKNRGIPPVILRAFH